MPPKKNNKPSNAEVMLEVMQLVDKHKKEDREDRRLIYDKLNKNSEVIAEMLPKLISCHNDINGNGKPGLKRSFAIHSSVQKWATGAIVTALSLICGGIITFVTANWKDIKKDFFIMMKVIEKEEQNNPLK